MAKAAKGIGTGRGQGENWRKESIKRKSRTRTIGLGTTVTTTSWNEGAERRKTVTLMLAPKAPVLSPVEVLAILVPAGALGGQAYVNSFIEDARTTARAIYRRGGLPHGHPVWWKAPRGGRLWLASQRSIHPASLKRRWRKIPEYKIAEEYKKPEGSPERLAGRILEAASVLENLLLSVNPDRWELVNAACDLQVLHGTFVDLYGKSADDRQGRPNAQIRYLHAKQGRRPTTSEVRKYLPGLKRESLAFQQNRKTRGWKAHLVRWLLSQPLAMTKRGAEMAIDRLVTQGALPPPRKSPAKG